MPNWCDSELLVTGEELPTEALKALQGVIDESRSGELRRVSPGVYRGHVRTAWMPPRDELLRIAKLATESIFILRCVEPLAGYQGTLVFQEGELILCDIFELEQTIRS